MAIFLSVVEEGAVVAERTISTNVVEVVNTDINTVVEVLGSPNPPVQLTVQTGPQGPPGVNNVHVGTTPPANPQTNFIWIDTS